MELNLVIDSDLHFTAAGIRADKADHLTKIEKLSESTYIDAIICAGDLTDNGFDGKSFLCWQYGGTEDQVTPLARYIERLQTIAPTYVAMGNHDHYVPWPYLHKGVRNFVKKRHGALLYSWECRGIFKFICLDVYPDAAALKFLKKELKSAAQKMVIIYFHYNVEGAWSDWWTDKEKNAFLAALEPYRKQIKLIICGHRHSNYLIEWEGYNVVSGGGGKLMVCTLLKKDLADDLTVRFEEY